MSWRPYGGFFKREEFLASSRSEANPISDPFVELAFGYFFPRRRRFHHPPVADRRNLARSPESTKQRPPPMARQLYFRSINQRLQSGIRSLHAAAERNIICFRNAAVISPHKSGDLSYECLARRPTKNHCRA